MPTNDAVNPKPEDVPKNEPADVPGNPAFYAELWFFGLAIIIALSVIAWMTWDDPILDVFGIIFNEGSTLLFIATIYLILSLKEVSAHEIAGAFCYGKALVPISPGLHFVPFGLMQIKSVSRTVQEFQCPGEPETVYKGDDKDELPPGMVRPIRAVTRAPKLKKTNEEENEAATEEEDGVLDTQMTLSINFVVQYAINDVFDFVSNFGNREEIEKQLRDIGEIQIVEDITQNTAAGFIKKLPEINAKLVGEVRKRFLNSGINIISVRLISPDITHGVSEALANVPKARAETQQVVIRAAGEEIKRTKEGAGTAAAERSLLTARAEGRKLMMDNLKVDGASVLAAEAVRDISSKTNVIVAGGEGGMRDMLSLVIGAKSALAVKPEEKTPSVPTTETKKGVPT